jgi:uncharacterized membrane protein YhhN
LTDHSALWSRILKIAASTAMVTIVFAASPTPTGYVLFITAGLAASWIGDLALSFAGNAPRSLEVVPQLHRGRRAFLAGLVSFALAHLLYVASFFARSSMDVVAIFFAGIVMAITATAILRWLSPYVPDELTFPVTVYIGIITVMVVTSFGTSGAFADPRIPTAAVLFMISDVLVARQQFVAPTRWNRIVGLPTYYAAQALFAITAIVAWS